MRNWQLEVALHWPHNRLAVGWDYIEPTQEFNYTTIKLYLFVLTLTLDIE
jgi:hypothetical protein